MVDIALELNIDFGHMDLNDCRLSMWEYAWEGYDGILQVRHSQLERRVKCTPLDIL